MYITYTKNVCRQADIESPALRHGYRWCEERGRGGFHRRREYLHICVVGLTWCCAGGYDGTRNDIVIPASGIGEQSAVITVETCRAGYILTQPVLGGKYIETAGQTSW